MFKSNDKLYYTAKQTYKRYSKNKVVCFICITANRTIHFHIFLIGGQRGTEGLKIDFYVNWIKLQNILA